MSQKTDLSYHKITTINIRGEPNERVKTTFTTKPVEAKNSAGQFTEIVPMVHCAEIEFR